MCYNERNGLNLLALKQKYMKKVLLSALAVAFFGGTVAAIVFAQENSQSSVYSNVKITEGRPISVLSETDGLEKILRPVDIKYFESIKKVDNSLYGKRKEKNQITTETSNRSKLEKIPHPAVIKDYENIRKIDNALWGERKNMISEEKKIRSTETNISDKKEIKNTETREPVLIKTVAVQCVKDAIDVKDLNLKSALNANNSTGITAIDARNACQKEALNNTSAQTQREANQACLETYHQTTWDSLNVLKQAKENGWKTYNDDLKICAQLQRETNTTKEEKILVEDGEMQINLKEASEAMMEK